MTSSSFQQFETLLLSVDQLVAIHRKIRIGRGRRHEQEAIHRAGVVMSVAAWQAYVEKVLEESLGHISNDIGGGAAPRWAVQSFELRQSVIKNDITKFNTPNDQNVQRIFQISLGFDPFPAWEWRQNRRQWNSKEFRKRTNAWVSIRHSVAHGFPLPDDISWIKGPNGEPRLTLNLLVECRKHFTYLAKKTDNSLADYLVATYGLPRPW